MPGASQCHNPNVSDGTWMPKKTTMAPKKRFSEKLVAPSEADLRNLQLFVLTIAVRLIVLMLVLLGLVILLSFLRFLPVDYMGDPCANISGQ